MRVARELQWRSVTARALPPLRTHANTTTNKPNKTDVGCMKMMVWSCDGTTGPQPADNYCPGFSFPVPGTVVA